jgi:DNA-directed RNA polymerase specialized sigma24 family protein
MNNSMKSSVDIDLRSLLKLQHKKVYSLCRLFARNYKEHQDLFINIIAAAAQNIRSRKDAGDNQTLLLRACINMAALHSILGDLHPKQDLSIQFKSPDYQRCMSELDQTVGDATDMEKFRLFLEFEKIPPEELAGLTGIPAYQHAKSQQKIQVLSKAQDLPKKNFIPYIKEKLIWS